jgi:hypothetical protein
VPQNCLAEVVTVPAQSDQPPAEIEWRGETIPVLEFGRDDGLPWRDRRGGTGLIAVVLGLQGGGCRYWGVAVRGEGLGVRAVGEEEIEDMPDAVLEHAIAAFRLRGVVYQVPDLPALQQSLTAPANGSAGQDFAATGQMESQ